jgi:hypothetical protein
VTKVRVNAEGTAIHAFRVIHAVDELDPTALRAGWVFDVNFEHGRILFIFSGETSWKTNA